MPICEKETDEKYLESSSKQQEVDDETVTGEKKAQQAIHYSLKGRGAATICFSQECHELVMIDYIKGLAFQAGLEPLIIIMIYACVHYTEMLYMTMCTSKINRKSKWLFCWSSVMTKFLLCDNCYNY